MEILSIAFTVSVCAHSFFFASFLFIWCMAKNNNCEIKTNNAEIKKTNDLRRATTPTNCDRWEKVLLMWFDFVDVFFSMSLVVCVFFFWIIHSFLLCVSKYLVLLSRIVQALWATTQPEHLQHWTKKKPFYFVMFFFFHFCITEKETNICKR